MGDYPYHGNDRHGFAHHHQQHSQIMTTTCNAGGYPPATTRPPRKAKRHRKRHVPVGPAGVWFQNFQQCSDTRASTSNDNSHRRRFRHNNDDEEEEEEEDQQDAWQNFRRSVQRRSAHSNTLASFSSPAWIAMQCDCRWVTPSPHGVTVEERYQEIRPYVPASFTMVYELLVDVKKGSENHGDHDLTLPEQQQEEQTLSSPWFCKNLMVLVANIHGGTTDHGWTVALTDETGATITAWIQPASVRRQLQRSGGSDATNSNHHHNKVGNVAWFRTGCVWWLRNSTLLLSPEAPESVETRTLSFLLLVSEDNVYKVWTPNDGESLSDEMYLQWMERRSQLQSSLEGNGRGSEREFNEDNERIPQHGDDGNSQSLSRRVPPRLSQENQRLGHFHKFSSSQSSPLQERITQHKHSSPMVDSRQTFETAHDSMPTLSQPLFSQQDSHVERAPRRSQSNRTRELQASPLYQEMERPVQRRQPHQSYPSMVTQPPSNVPIFQNNSTQDDAFQNMTSNNNSQETVTASGNTLPSLPTVAPTPQNPGRASAAGGSPFAAFAYTGPSRDFDEAVASRRVPAASKHQDSPLRNSSTLADQVDSRASQSNERSPLCNRQSNAQNNGAGQAHGQETISTMPSRQASATTPTTSKSTDRAATTMSSCSSKKKDTSSARKRRRLASKLWSGTFCLDFSDDDYDDDEDEDCIDIRMIVKPVKLKLEENMVKEDPPRKKSLFHSEEALRELVNALSSDSDEEDNDEEDKIQILKRSGPA